MMKQKINKILIPLFVLLLALCFAGCAAEQSAYEKNNEEGYCVSVKFDANGGVFTTNTSVIVDSFKLEELPVNGSGKAQAALIAPDDPIRGNDAFTPAKSGYFLAGWYATRTQVSGGEGEQYTYADKWDFSSDVLELDRDQTYSSQEPVLTLYAAWVPMFQVEFYSRTDGSLVGSYSYDPTTAEHLKVPAWNQKTGAIDMYRFPEVKGSTFSAVYYDEAGKQPVTTETITHTGLVDYTTGTAQEPTMKLYVDYMEGEWYHIYNATQFVENANVNGCYEIYDDLDFADVIWPTSFVYGNFSGQINGNGHVMRNIQITQTNNSKVYAGLFGCVTEQAKISDLTLENVSLTIKAGTRVAGTSYGLFAGSIADGATISNVSIDSGTLYIDSQCYFGVSDYAIGLVCGMGNSDLIENAQITCKATGDAPDTVHITVTDGQVTVEIVTP